MQFAIKLKDGSEWRAIAPSRTRRAIGLKLQDGVKQLYMRIYPQTNLREVVISFNIRGFQETPYEDCRPNEFILAGCWQFIPQSRKPVISVHRNPQTHIPHSQLAH